VRSRAAPARHDDEPTGGEQLVAPREHAPRERVEAARRRLGEVELAQQVRGDDELEPTQAAGTSRESSAATMPGRDAIDENDPEPRRSAPAGPRRRARPRARSSARAGAAAS